MSYMEMFGKSVLPSGEDLLQVFGVLLVFVLLVFVLLVLGVFVFGLFVGVFVSSENLMTPFAGPLPPSRPAAQCVAAELPRVL